MSEPRYGAAKVYISGTIHLSEDGGHSWRPIRSASRPSADDRIDLEALARRWMDGRVDIQRDGRWITVFDPRPRPGGDALSEIALLKEALTIDGEPATLDGVMARIVSIETGLANHTAQIGRMEEPLAMLVNAAAERGGGASWEGEADKRIAALEYVVNGCPHEEPGLKSDVQGLETGFDRLMTETKRLDTLIDGLASVGVQRHNELDQRIIKLEKALADVPHAHLYADLKRRLARLEPTALEGLDAHTAATVVDADGTVTKSRTGEPPVGSTLSLERQLKLAHEETERAMKTVDELRARIVHRDQTVSPREADLSHALDRIRVERDAARAMADQYKGDHLRSCELVAAMHAAAMGKVTGPVRGVVEDVADIRARMLALESQPRLDAFMVSTLTAHAVGILEAAARLEQSDRQSDIIRHAQSIRLAMPALTDLAADDHIDTRAAAQEEPAPVPTDRKASWTQVISSAAAIYNNTAKSKPKLVTQVLSDMKARDNEGRKRYGTPLTSGNGRRHLVDAYQEHLDYVVYLATWLDENGHAVDVEGDGQWSPLASSIANQYEAAIWKLLVLREAIDEESATMGGGKGATVG